MSVLIQRLKRQRRQQRLAQRLRRASGQPTVAFQFRQASIVIALCMMFVLMAQLYHAYARAHDRTLLKQARAVEEIVHDLKADSAIFHVAAVDLINEANAGEDSAVRQLQMSKAVSDLQTNFVRIQNLAPQAYSIRNSAASVAYLDDAAALVLSVSPENNPEQRENIEERIEQYVDQLESGIAVNGQWALATRRSFATQFEQNDRIAGMIIIAATALAFGVGLFFFQRLHRGVFPVANHLRQVIVAMANGRLENELPDQYYREPQQMTLALRKLRAAARREQQYARIDFLTDLPNRRAMAEALAEWPKGRPGAILIVDIDGFKLVNDSFGHPAGDELIRQIAARLLDIAPKKSLVARLGGDEFAMLVSLDDPTKNAALGAKIVAACSDPINAMGTSLSISVSVGIAPLDFSHGQRLDLAEALRPADLALYAAKADGRNGCAVFTPDMQASSDFLHVIESELGAAIGENGLHLAFQPIVSVNGNEQEVEALVRWTHPKLGAVSPEQLIEVAERSGQMERLGNWIADAALDALSQWPHLSISLNLSPRQLRAPNFAAHLVAQCRRRHIAPRRVILEITESVAVDNGDQAFLALSLLQTVGFRIALDDFGKGYSSLWMLKQFAFDRTKIDRSLVEDIDRSAQARAVLQAAVSMGRQLGMEVVAEGVENSLLADELTKIGCTHLQGYWLSRPLEQSLVTDFYAEPPSGLRIAS